MGFPTPNHLFTAEHSGIDTPDDPNLFNVFEIATSATGAVNARSPQYAGGAKGDGIADDSAALQAAINAAANASDLVLPYGDYLCKTPLTLTDKSLRIISTGGVGSRFRGGVNGDTNNTGAQIRYGGTSGNLWTVTANAGVKVKFESLGVAYVGNADVAGATTGGGLYFKAANTTGSIHLEIDRINLTKAKGDGITLEGNVFEGGISGSVSQCGSIGFKAYGSGGGIPGEFSFRGFSAFSCNVGVDLSGGGSFVYSRLSCTANTTYGLKADGVHLTGTSLSLEANGPTFALIQNCFKPQIAGLGINFNTAPTSTGISFVSVVGGTVSGFFTNSGAGNTDFTLDSGTQRLTIADFYPGSGAYTDSGYGNVIRRGQELLTSFVLPYETPAYSASVPINGKQFNIHKITVTDGVGFTVGAPTIGVGYVAGTTMVVDVLNSSGGALGTVAWHASYKLAGAWVSPANTKRRTISFYYDGSAWVETSRAAADI